MGKKKSKKGRCAKRNAQHDGGEPEELKKAPHSFVIHRGPVGKYVHILTKDFRKVMEPFTATSLKTEQSPYLKLARLPRGPTLTFKVLNYSLVHDVLAAQRRPQVVAKSFRHSPLVVLNSFSGEGLQLKLMASMFQNMFPTINVRKVNLNSIRRCVLLNYNPVSKLIDFRHYSIKVLPVGVSKGVKKIIQSKVPNLGHFSDISEFLTKSEVLSESEYEDDPASHVILPQDLASRGNCASTKSGIRVHEIGPRLTLQLIKVEDGLLAGEVLFHELFHLTEEEKLAIQKKREQKRKLKEKRRKVQEENRKKKELMKEEHKQKSLEGMKLPKKEEMETVAKTEDVEEEEDDDVEWYRKEVGEEPDKELFNQERRLGQKRKVPFRAGVLHKKKKKDNDQSKNVSHKHFNTKASENQTKKFRKNKISVPGRNNKTKFSNKGKRKLKK
ncbi:protein Peter pan isoform X2 [Bacillus rossius redtenbacheri]|uniref:protein Peter pan isoform X2 n=1 Tax=Bacillus rossius redtenbacheri TaxID=93214 RepID=UPI002FDCAC4C